MAIAEVFTDLAPPGQRGTSRTGRAATFARLAVLHDGIVHRDDLRRAGVTRADLRTEVRAGRWRLAGRYTVLLVGTELSGRARWQWAIWESGSGAALDGVTALQAAGLENFDQPTVHISVPSANATHDLHGVTLHRPNDVGTTIGGPVTRVMPEIACLRAAGWAVTDRTAALIIAMAVQQGVVHGERLQAEWAKVGYTARRGTIAQSIQDVCDGAESLGELDFAALCASYGLPSPERQIHRQRPNGVAYIDAGWEHIGLLVEIDGSQHFTTEGITSDALRQNDVMLGNERVLRIPLFGLRHHPEKFMDQVVRAHREAMGRT